MSSTPIWQAEYSDGPLVACAIHDGDYVRPEVAACLLPDAAQRRYEEDPFTAEWTAIAPTRIVARRSRFEVDLNRPRDKAVYLTPADAWGLELWKSTPAPEIVAKSLQEYDDFYEHLRFLLDRLVSRHGKVVVLDLHSYNHIRGGAGGAAGEPEANPEVNLGTGTMNRTAWSPVIDRWLTAMRAYDFFGRRLDVRENVKFFGGQLPRWIHKNFPHTVCALAIEVKKFFMNEWTGQLNGDQHREIGKALAGAASAVREELENLKREPTVA
ncbi:MAG TPA: N-formylglutamate amidohydrolase [Lacipirellulaceae bacterium]|nr:N-formylglutamate amidohydrolase [Lacipirellulaceae bacterium]